MSKRVIAVLVAAVLSLTVAGALWAEYGTSMGKEEPMKMASYDKEFDRCTMTCTMLMDNYNKRFAARKAHEGDKQCWDTCWARYGTESKGTATQMKDMWMKNRPENMRANQCAQACWRLNNDNSNTVAVGGWRSSPRTVVCTP